jgi:hypothetical protein
MYAWNGRPLVTPYETIIAFTLSVHRNIHVKDVSTQSQELHLLRTIVKSMQGIVMFNSVSTWC